jgi:imidazolonepropionase-like amidohydrolase
MIARLLFAPLPLLAFLACSPARSAMPMEPARREAGSLAIVHVDVVPMDADRVLADHTIIVRDGRIAALAPSAELGPEVGTPTIDGRGQYVLPGLIDMHVHIAAADLEAYVRSGVTTVRNMWGYDELPPVIAAIEEGRRIGPRIVSLSAGFDGAPGVWPQTQISDDVRTIPANLDHQVALGFREIKVYQRLTRAAYDTIVALAARRDLTFAGHLPSAIPLRYAIDAGQRSIEHLGGFRSSTQLAADARYAAERDVYVCPTLEVQSILNRGNGDAGRTAVTRELHRQGVKLLVGTDAGIGATAPGSSIHDELAAFVAAGMSPFEALRGATALAAEYLGQVEHIGRIAVSLEADLVLVRGNPLRAIASTRAIEAVILNGARVR